MGLLIPGQVIGAQRILHNMHGSPVAAIKLFSSIAAALGSGGQANYAAANAVLDAQASALQAQVLTSPSSIPDLCLRLTLMHCQHQDTNAIYRDLQTDL